MNYNNLIITLIFVIILTCTLKLFDNKSGVSTCFILPSAIAAISIYLIGGCDMQKPDWCPIDIITWLMIFIIAFIICISPFPKPKQSSNKFNSHQPPPHHSL
jgi:hypothetical protein